MIILKFIQFLSFNLHGAVVKMITCDIKTSGVAKKQTCKDPVTVV